MGRLLAGLVPELSLLVSESKAGVVSSPARWEGRPTSEQEWRRQGHPVHTLQRPVQSDGPSCVRHLSQSP